MTKQHFQAFADEIASIAIITERNAAALAVANVAQRFNPRFDRARFLTACRYVDLTEVH
jgi:hypothetical protein